MVGMYGGSFDPLHNGHLHCIEEALKLCTKLYIILSYSNNDHISYKLRASWLKVEVEGLIREKGIVCDYEIVPVYYEATSKSAYDWHQGTLDIINTIQSKQNTPLKTVNPREVFDIVFAGGEYEGSGEFREQYGDKVYYIPRSNISSTEIRSNPYKYWEQIPRSVQIYYTKRVLVIGGESVGKSTLVRKLANEYNTAYVEEVGRAVSDRSISEQFMPDQDFGEILIMHKALEYQQLQLSNKLLFLDTDALTTLFYTHELISNPEIKKNTVKLAEAMADLYRNTYDLVLFLEPENTKAVQDGTRNEDILQNRKLYSDKLKSYYKSHGYPIISLGGTYKDREAVIEKLIDGLGIQSKQYK